MADAPARKSEMGELKKIGIVLLILFGIPLAIYGYVRYQEANDPETSVLPAGSQAVIAEDRTFLGFDKLEPGTRVTIGSDPGDKAPSGRSKYRDIRVVVETGKYQGTAGSIIRGHLRPTR